MGRFQSSPGSIKCKQVENSCFHAVVLQVWPPDRQHLHSRVLSRNAHSQVPSQNLISTDGAQQSVFSHTFQVILMHNTVEECQFWRSSVWERTVLVNRCSSGPAQLLLTNSANNAFVPPLTSASPSYPDLILT